MKKISLFIALITATLLSCSNNSSKPSTKKIDRLKGTTVKEISDFNTFFKKFKTDSVYQIAHVKFPFSITITGDEGESDSVRYIEKNKWQNITFKKDKNDIYKQTQLSKTEASIEYTVEDTGIFSSFNFLYRNGKWQLVSFKDQSD